MRERLATQRGFLLPREGFGSSPSPRRGGAKLEEWGEWAALLAAVLGCACAAYVFWRLLALLSAFYSLH